MSNIRSKALSKCEPLLQRLAGQRIFITGGTGFFGRSILDLLSSSIQLSTLNLEIDVLTRNPKGFLEKFPNLKGRTWLRLVEGDMTRFEFSDRKYDHVLHLATPSTKLNTNQNPLKLFDEVISGSRRVLEFARFSGAKNFLLASSGAVYGQQPPEMPNVPESFSGSPSLESFHSVYGESKRVAELLGNLYADAGYFEHKIARCFAFVGPHLDMQGQYAIGNFLSDAIRNKPIEILGDGTPVRSYLYADDLVIWLFKILLDGRSKQPYNVGDERGISMRELAETIVKLIRPALPIKTHRIPSLKKLPQRYVPATTIARSELQLESWTSLEEAILETTEAALSATSQMGRNP